jgi:D-alanyl-D-alanine carboxypeptidase/D-alanyl-D-alanine-endopeptidase (penicillin-binding protein 4)
VNFSDSAPPEFKKAFVDLQRWAVRNGGKVHAALVDLESDQWLLRAEAAAPVNPASNAKILTAAAALELLGPAYQFGTRLYGDIETNGRCARLVLQGGGAPDLSTADLWRLLRVAQGEGLSEVGDIVVDQSRFGSQYVPPAFDQQPNEWAPFRAPVSALSINQNALTLNVVPTKAGEDARVWYDPPGIVEEKGRVVTRDSGRGDQVSWSLDPKKDAQRPISSVGGSLAEGLDRRRYSRRLEDPRLAGGYALRSLLEESDIEIKGKVILGPLKKESRIALWNSEPVAELIRALGKDSDNFFAEMLFVALSSADGSDVDDRPWTSERGAAAVKKWLSEKKIGLDGMVIKNGSGLFDANRLSAELLAKVLAQVEDNPRIYQDFVSHLAMGSTDGTMKSRMKDSDLGQRVRAKTGTLRDVDALSGYLQRTEGRSPAAFSVIVVGVNSGHATVRAKVDDLILAWAKILNASVKGRAAP